MGKQYTILDQTHKMMGSIYAVLVDNMDGFDHFVLVHADILPGSTVDVADFRMMFRLRHDGSWEELYDYSTGDVQVQQEAVASVLDGIIPDDMIEEDSV